MAGTLTKDEIREMEVLDYARLRATLRSGDLLFASGNHWISKAIQKVTDSPWSHVGIVFNVSSIDRVLLLESVESQGVRFAPLSKYLKDYDKGKPYDGMVALGRCDGIDTAVIEELSRSGIDHLTMSYDKDEIAKILARVAMGKGKHKRDREYICSELVHECFLEAGVNFKKDRRGFVSPQNIWADAKVSLIGRIL
jgi:uncharacterized protein YycO